MNIFQRYIGIFIACTAIIFPLTASAHAAPVQSSPQSSATIATTTDQVSILFSERVDEAASSIKVTGPSGDIVSTADAKVSISDPRRLSVSVQPDGNGTYLVSWSVVSAD